MNIEERLFILATVLDRNGYTDLSNTIAQALEITDVRQVGIITPEHPLYNRIQQLLHSNTAIETKISEFNERLKLAQFKKDI